MFQNYLTSLSRSRDDYDGTQKTVVATQRCKCASVWLQCKPTNRAMSAERPQILLALTGIAVLGQVGCRSEHQKT